jgi:hypothetical protein
MYDGNPVHIHTGRYPRGIDVSNFVPEERFSGGNKLFSEIQLCGKRRVNREKGGPNVECLCTDTVLSCLKKVTV